MDTKASDDAAKKAAVDAPKEVAAEDAAKKDAVEKK